MHAKLSETHRAVEEIRRLRVTPGLSISAKRELDEIEDALVQREAKRNRIH